MVVFCTKASPYYDDIFEATFLFLLVEGGIGSRLLGVTLRVKLRIGIKKQENQNSRPAAPKNFRSSDTLSRRWKIWTRLFSNNAASAGCRIIFLCFAFCPDFVIWTDLVFCQCLRVLHLTLSPSIPPGLGRLSPLVWDLWIDPSKVGVPALHLEIICCFWRIFSIENLFHSHSGSAWSSGIDLLRSLSNQLKNGISIIWWC